MHLSRLATLCALMAACSCSTNSAHAATDKPITTGDESVKMVWQKDRSGFVVSTNSGASFKFNTKSNAMVFVDESGAKYTFDFAGE